MERKFKDDYQKEEITRRRISELGFRYLQVWFFIFLLYFLCEQYLVVLSDFTVNGKTLPLLDLLVYSFLIAWIIPFSRAYLKEIDLRKIKQDLLKKIRSQKKKISLYKGQFKDGYPESTRYRKKSRQDGK